MMTAAMPVLPHVTVRMPGVRWFSGGGCVISRSDGGRDVYVGGMLIGHYDAGERGARNAILVGLARDARMHLGQLAKAFELSSDGLREIRRVFEAKGLAGILVRNPGGRPTKLDDGLRCRLEKLFEAGATVSAAYAKVVRRRKIGRALVGRARKEWAARRRAEAQAGTDGDPPATTAMLPGVAPAEISISVSATKPDAVSASASVAVTASALVVAPTAGDRDAGDRGGRADSQGAGADTTISGAPGSVHGGEIVQHVGSWLLLGLLEKYGLYGVAGKVCRDHALDAGSTRVALDATVVALALGQGCVEGVRRIATPTAPLLLRAANAPSADFVRVTLGRLADVGTPALHFGMAGRYLAAARAQRESGPVPFYLDNHLRPYTGKEVIRRGWRMQDKRVRPGITDHYVHDVDGRPVLRTVTTDHASLPECLFPIADLLHIGLGGEERILIGFDRAGAYPETMAQLRDHEHRYEFVTYERRPYPILPSTAFDREFTLDDEELRFTETRINLGAGRGRVRRIAVRMPDERQVNLVAVGDSSAEWLIAFMRGRWVQENGFKHGVERWGVNQLDGRRTCPYAADTIVPNPARRRLDHALRLARMREGHARCDLLELPDGDHRRERLEQDIAQAVRERRSLLEQRPTVPKRAPLCETELAGKLVFHDGLYKTVLDTVRIACANAEADLAAMLAPLLPRAAEAKKTVANLLAAPGRVLLDRGAVRVALAPAGTGPEQLAFAKFYAQIDAARLTLPGDPDRRRLRFGSRVS
jgi:hypothetical protein